MGFIKYYWGNCRWFLIFYIVTNINIYILSKFGNDGMFSFYIWCCFTFFIFLIVTIITVVQYNELQREEKKWRDINDWRAYNKRLEDKRNNELK